MIPQILTLICFLFVVLVHTITEDGKKRAPKDTLMSLSAECLYQAILIWGGWYSVFLGGAK